MMRAKPARLSRRIEKVELPPEDLVEYAGRYFSRELEVFYELRVEDGKLTVHHIRTAPLELNHQEGDNFSGPSLFTTVAFQRAGNGTITGFTVSNGRTKGVLFERQ